MLWLLFCYRLQPHYSSNKPLVHNGLSESYATYNSRSHTPSAPHTCTLILFMVKTSLILTDTTNETAGAFVPAQILYDVFHGRYQSSTGAIILLCIIWGSFFFGGLSITTSAARVRSRSSILITMAKNPPEAQSSIERCVAMRSHLHPPPPSNPEVNVIFVAITSICMIEWVGGYAVPIFARMVMPEKYFKAGPFYLGRLSRPFCFVAFLWICYTCSVFLLPTYYPISWSTFNYAPVAFSAGLGLIMLWWTVSARKWFKGPVRNIEADHGEKV